MNARRRCFSISIKQYFNNLSIRGEARAIKVTIASLIAVFLSTKFKFIEATTTSLTIFLVFAMFFTVSGSRGYAKQRILSNIYALLISLVIGIIFHWNMYAIPLIYFLVLIMYFKLNLEGKVSLLSTGVAAMTFYVGDGNIVSIEHRFVSIIVGFTIAILTNEIILPTNNGLIVENEISDFSGDIFRIKQSIIESKGIGNLNINNLSKQIKSINASTLLLEKEIKSAPFRNHLKNYKNKIDEFKKLSIVSEKSHELIRFLNEEKNLFNILNNKEKFLLIDILNELYDSHKILLENILHNIYNNKVDVHKIDCSKFELDNKFKIVLISKFLEYEEALVVLSKVEKINSKKGLS